MNNNFLKLSYCFSFAYFFNSAESASAQPKITADYPEDVDYPMATPPATPLSYSDLQEKYDNWSWAMFVAINWPSNEGSATTIWETWGDPVDLFGAADPEEKKFYKSRRKNGRLLLSAHLDVQAASALPLVDKGGNFAITQIVINPIASKFIQANKLNDFETIRKKDQMALPNGSIELKATWRMFPKNTKEDDPELKRYHIRRADVFVGADKIKDGKEPFIIENVFVGLVGLHVIQKSEKQPDWIWATFEQVDNSSITYKKDQIPGLAPTFNEFSVPVGDNPTSALANIRARANHAPTFKDSRGLPSKYYWTPSGSSTAENYSPSTITFCANEPALPSAVNDAWRNSLIKHNKDSVWQYYQLNTTQWYQRLQDPLTGNYVNGLAYPRNEADVSISRNSVLESYLIGNQTLAAQVPAVDPRNLSIDLSGKKPQTTLDDIYVQSRINFSSSTSVNTWSSCVLCHNYAYVHIRANNKLHIEDKVIPTNGSYLWFTFLQQPKAKKE